MTSPYALPDGNVQIAFSGGRTSAYMLHQILEANGGLPERARVVFTNTGREMPQTLDFVQECSERFGVHVDWVEYRPEPPMFEVVSHNSAARDGGPFEMLAMKRGGVPNRMARFCTIELKIRSAKLFVMSLGWDGWTTATGIRADEPRRIKPENVRKDRFLLWYPLHHAGVSKHDVAAFWSGQPFDLRLPNVNGRTQLGNCDGCFLKSEAARAALARDHPERFRWWADLEVKMSKVRAERENKGPATFIAHQKYADLENFVARQGDWIFADEAALCQADDGECVT